MPYLCWTSLIIGSQIFLLYTSNRIFNLHQTLFYQKGRKANAYNRAAFLPELLLEGKLQNIASENQQR